MQINVMLLEGISRGSATGSGSRMGSWGRGDRCLCAYPNLRTVYAGGEAALPANWATGRAVYRPGGGADDASPDHSEVAGLAPYIPPPLEERYATTVG